MGALQASEALSRLLECSRSLPNTGPKGWSLQAWFGGFVLSPVVCGILRLIKWKWLPNLEVWLALEEGGEQRTSQKELGGREKVGRGLVAASMGLQKPPRLGHQMLDVWRRKRKEFKVKK